MAALHALGRLGVEVTSIDVGSGTFSTGTSNQLVIGSSGSDTIAVSGNNDCVVGGAGTDAVTGLGTNDQCIVSNASLVIVGCTIVARRP